MPDLLSIVLDLGIADGESYLWQQLRDPDAEPSERFPVELLEVALRIAEQHMPRDGLGELEGGVESEQRFPLAEELRDAIPLVFQPFMLPEDTAMDEEWAYAQSSLSSLVHGTGAVDLAEMLERKAELRGYFCALWRKITEALGTLQSQRDCGDDTGAVVHRVCDFFAREGHGFMVVVLERYLTAPELLYTVLVWDCLGVLIPGVPREQRRNMAVQLADGLYARSGQCFDLFAQACDEVRPQMACTDEDITALRQQARCLRKQHHELHSSVGDAENKTVFVRAMATFLRTFLGANSTPNPEFWRQGVIKSVMGRSRGVLEQCAGVLNSETLDRDDVHIQAVFLAAGKWLAIHDIVLHKFFDEYLRAEITALVGLRYGDRADLEDVEVLFRSNGPGSLAMAMVRYLDNIGFGEHVTAR